MDMPARPITHWNTRRSLYAADGQRKYLNLDERRRFLEAARKAPEPDTLTLCIVLAYTGCRISEALELTQASLLASEGLIAIRSLKKRGVLDVREIPVPPAVMGALSPNRCSPSADRHLFAFGRTEAWKRVAGIMHAAGITGTCASSRGLRHSFAVSAVLAGVPLNTVQKWLGHATIATTTIYTNVVGKEERELAQRLWLTWGG